MRAFWKCPMAESSVSVFTVVPLSAATVAPNAYHGPTRLIANGYTSPQRLAIAGHSNGGLLVGAVLNQRPELIGSRVAGVAT